MLHQFLLSFITLFPSVSFPANRVYSKVATEMITITVTAGGNARIGNSSIVLDKLHTAIEKKLWNKYLSTGKMQDRLQLRYKGEVLMGVRGAALDELIEAQQHTLKKLCIKKYVKAYDLLTLARQVYLKRKFPVLFQQDYQ